MRNLVAILMLVAVTSLGTVALWKFLAHDDASSDGLGQLAPPHRVISESDEPEVDWWSGLTY